MCRYGRWKVFAGFAEEDPRSRTAAAGVPVIALFAEGDIGPNLIRRRADSDNASDLYRRYEVAGATHADAADTSRGTRQWPGSTQPLCLPVGVQDTDFPARHAIDAAWRHLDAWVRNAKAPPRAFFCMGDGYMYSFGSGEQYVRRVRARARALRGQGWLTSADEREILTDAWARSIVF